MKIYYLMGRYCRTQDEARAHAKAKGVTFNPAEDRVEVPTDHEGLTDYLNRVLEAMRAQATRWPAEREVPHTDGPARFRAFFKNTFAGVVLADNETEAEAKAASLLTVRRVP